MFTIPDFTDSGTTAGIEPAVISYGVCVCVCVCVQTVTSTPLPRGCPFSYMNSAISYHDFSCMYLFVYSGALFSHSAGFSCTHCINKSTSNMTIFRLVGGGARCGSAGRPDCVTPAIELHVFSPTARELAARANRSMLRELRAPAPGPYRVTPAIGLCVLSHYAGPHTICPQRENRPV